MEIIEYFCAENQEHWLSKIGESDWGAGRYLYELLRDGKLKQLVGEHARVLLLAEVHGSDSLDRVGIYLSRLQGKALRRNTAGTCRGIGEKGRHAAYLHLNGP